MGKVSGVRKAIEYAMRSASRNQVGKPFRGPASKQSWEWPTRQADLQIRGINREMANRKHVRRMALAAGGAGAGAGVIAYRSKGEK